MVNQYFEFAAPKAGVCLVLNKLLRTIGQSFGILLTKAFQTFGRLRYIHLALASMLISTRVRAPHARVCGIHEIAPLEDSRWPAFLDGHDGASVFHSRECLDALSRTYGYRVSAL